MSDVLNLGPADGWAPVVTAPVVTEERAPVDDFAPVNPPPRALTQDEEASIEPIIQSAPEPDKTRAIYDQATAIHQGLGVPFSAAFEQARALVDSPNPEQKKLGVAITDEWKRAFSGQRRGDLGSKLRATTDPAERVKIQQQIKELEAAMPTDDPTRQNFLARMLLGGVNLAGQQIAGLASTGQQVAEGSVQRGLVGLGQFAKNALTFRWRDQARLLAGLPAAAAKTTGIGRAEGGNSYIDMVDAGVPHEIAGPLSDAVATFNTGIELLSDATMAKLFGPLKARSASVLKAVGMRLGWGGAMTQLGLRLAAKWAAGTATNLGEEFTQDTITFLAEEAAKAEAGEQGIEAIDTATWQQRMEGVVDAIPGFLAMGMLPGIAEGVRSLAQTTTAKPSAAVSAEPVTPPMAETRATIEAAPTPEAKVAAITTAETAKLDEISRAEVLSAGMVADAVELADMRDAAEAEQGVTAEPVEAAPAVKPLSFLNDRFGQPIVVYHGTAANFEQFSRDFLGTSTGGGGASEAFYFAGSLSDSDLYASISEDRLTKAYDQKLAELEMKVEDASTAHEKTNATLALDALQAKKPKGHIGRFNLVVQNPLVLGFDDEESSVRGELLAELLSNDAEAIAYAKRNGFDAVILPYGNDANSDYTVMVFAPEQIVAASELGGKGPTVEAGAEVTPETLSAQVRPPEAIRADVRAGVFVPDVEIGAHFAQPWAWQEYTNRKELRAEASRLSGVGQAPDFDTFLAHIKATEITPHTDEYYRGIWDTAPKTELTLDEQAEEDPVAREAAMTEERIDTAIETEGADIAAWSPTEEQMQEAADATTVRQVMREWDGIQRKPADDAIENPIRKRKAVVEKLLRNFLKEPTAAIGQASINELRALQSGYTKKETKYLEGAKKALRAWQAAHPGAELLPEGKALIGEQSLLDLNIGELRRLSELAKEIRSRGYMEEWKRRAAIKAARVQLASDLLGEIPGGVAIERLAEYASIETKAEEAKLKRKGKIKANALHPLRIFQSLGKTFERAFWGVRKAQEGIESARLAKLDTEYRELLRRTKVKPAELLQRFKGYWIDDLLYCYGQMKDENGRRAVLYGNDENETKLTRIIGALPQNYHDFMDGLLELNNAHYGEVAKVQIEQNGVSAPQVRHYLPMKRESATGGSFAADLSTDTAWRNSAASIQKGFTHERLKFAEGTQQKRIRTDLLNIIVESAHQESRYVALEPWARDMGWLLGGRAKESKMLIEAVKQKHGLPMVQFLKDYVKAVVQPESFNGQHFAGLTSRFFRNLNDAVLMYKVGTALIQVEGPFRYLSQLRITQWHHLLGGLWKATLQPGKTLGTMYEKSPVMRAMVGDGAIDPALAEGRGFHHSRSEIGLGLQLARKAMKEGGYAMLQAMNKWTIASGWTAVYQAELKRTGNDTVAVKAADDATFLTQPSGKLADAPRMYWTSKSNVLLSFLLRFSRASNQMAQMMTVDMFRALKKGHVDKMLAIAMSFAIGAFINGLRRRKRFPENPEELMQDGLAGLADSIGSMTYGAGGAVMAGADVAGGSMVTEIKPLESAQSAGALLKKTVEGDVSGKDVWRVINLVMQLGGLPAPAAENLVRSVYDFDTGEWRFDPLELLGRKPRGE